MLNDVTLQGFPLVENENEILLRHDDLYVTSCFRREVDENCDILGCYVTESVHSLLTFRDNLSGLTFGRRRIRLSRNVGKELQLAA